MVQISVSRRHVVYLLVAVVVLVIAIPVAVSAATQRFTDVPPSDWAYEDIEWLAANGLTNGCGDGTTFCPDDPVKRREMAAFIHRLSGDNAATLTGRLDALESDVAALQVENAALKALLAGVSRNGDILLFEGVNLQVVNGEGTTATSNGLGNVIIGYDADPDPAETRTGSHYLVVGDNHTYSSYGGAVIGRSNNATGAWASVTGGSGNTASGPNASVTGGDGNTASGPNASVTGGILSTASGGHASVTGGYYNDATAVYSSVTGGGNNTASGWVSSVTGGNANIADGNSSSVTGGENNTAGGSRSSVTGGENNIADGNYSSVTGGYHNQVAAGVGDHDTVVGGDDNTNIGWPGAIVVGDGFWNEWND